MDFADTPPTFASNLFSERHHGTFNRTGSGVLSEIPCPKDPCAAGQAFFRDLDDLIPPPLVGFDHLIDVKILNAPEQ
jgi:hypothetical protein